jgi:hypothetical protein
MKTTKSIIALLFMLLTAQAVFAWYDPSTQRWLSRDPVGEPGFQVLREATAMPGTGSRAEMSSARWIKRDSADLYTFVNNDPFTTIDPDGQFPWKWPWNWNKTDVKNVGKDIWDKVYDKLKDEVKDKIKDYLGQKTMKDAYDACNQIKCMDHNDANYPITCMLCSVFQCAKAGPLSALALERCMTAKAIKCDGHEDP